MEWRGKGKRGEDNKGGGVAERVKLEVVENVFLLCRFCHLCITLNRKMLTGFYVDWLRCSRTFTKPQGKSSIKGAATSTNSVSLLNLVKMSPFFLVYSSIFVLYRCSDRHINQKP